PLLPYHLGKSGKTRSRPHLRRDPIMAPRVSTSPCGDDAFSRVSGAYGGGVVMVNQTSDKWMSVPSDERCLQVPIRSGRWNIPALSERSFKSTKNTYPGCSTLLSELRVLLELCVNSFSFNFQLSTVNLFRQSSIAQPPCAIPKNLCFPLRAPRILWMGQIRRNPPNEMQKHRCGM